MHRGPLTPPEPPTSNATTTDDRLDRLIDVTPIAHTAEHRLEFVDIVSNEFKIVVG
jgi:hypothetical protein